MLLRRLVRFSLSKQNLEQLLTAGKLTRITDKQNENRTKELFSDVSQKLDQYVPEMQIKFLRLFSQFGLKDDAMLEKVELQLSKNLKKLKMQDKLSLMKSLHKFHGRYNPQKPIFTSLNTNLLSLQKPKGPEIYKLFLLFDKLKWSSKAFNNLLFHCLGNNEFDSFKVEELIKIGIIVAQQNFINLKSLANLLEVVHKKVEETTFSKMTEDNIALVYHLFYSDFLRKRVQIIYDTLKIKNDFSNVLGQASFMSNIDKEKQEVLEVIDKIEKNREAYEDKLRKMKDFQPSSVILISDTKDSGLHEKFQKVYQDKMMNMKPIEFARLAKKYGKSQDFFTFYDTFQHIMNTNQKLFLLNSAYEWTNKQELRKRVQNLISTKQQIDSRKFVRLFELAMATKVKQDKILGYIEKVQQQYREDKSV